MYVLQMYWLYIHSFIANYFCKMCIILEGSVIVLNVEGSETISPILICCVVSGFCCCCC